MAVFSGAVLLAGLAFGAVDSPNCVDTRNAQRIPIPSRWQGRAGKFLDGEKVTVEFRANGEVRIAWESVGIFFEELKFDTSSSPPRMELGASASGTYSFQGNRLKIRITNLQLTVGRGGNVSDAAKAGIKLDLVRQEP